MVYGRPDGQHRGGVSTQSRAFGVVQLDIDWTWCCGIAAIGEGGYGNDFVHLEAEVAEEGAEQSRQEKRTESAGVQRAAELAHDIGQARKRALA